MKQSAHNPTGCNLRLAFDIRGDFINRISWSPHGTYLAAPTWKNSVRIWNIETGQCVHILEGHYDSVRSVAWSPDGSRLASASLDHLVKIYDTKSGDLLFTLEGHTAGVASIAWSPDNLHIATGASDDTIRVWNAETGENVSILRPYSDYTIWSLSWSSDGSSLAAGLASGCVQVWNPKSSEVTRSFLGHTDSVYSVAWSPDDRLIASASGDNTIRIWDIRLGRPIAILEAHTKDVISVSFSADGNLLASKSLDGKVRLWRLDTFETPISIDEPVVGFLAGLDFHPADPVLATPGRRDSELRIWDLDTEAIMKAPPEMKSVHYTNAKVVLVGDSGVGKSGLALVLTGQDFAPTESTHGRHVWLFDTDTAELPTGGDVTREILLWDLAGQPSYRLIHQLHLSEVSVALVVFDARSETDPFAGVRHWNRALEQSRVVQGDSALTLKKFLVSARNDCGGIPVHRSRIEKLAEEMGFDGYFETSAKEGWGIKELASAIRGAISWESLPRTSTTQLFQRIKSHLVHSKSTGVLLTTVSELFQSFIDSTEASAETENLRDQFITCIMRLEARGLIHRRRFGDLVLLQPEMLDAYASAIVNAARLNAAGEGSIVEDDVIHGRFRMAESERIRDRDDEKLLLITTVEEMITHEVALREDSPQGAILVFPSQFTRDWADVPEPDGQSVIFRFDGPIMNIYSTLAVRLSVSGTFRRDELWKNIATFKSGSDGVYGLWLREFQEGRGELTLFFQGDTSETDRNQFEEFVRNHLIRRALPTSISRRRVFICPECRVTITNQMVSERKERGHDSLKCPVCESTVSLSEDEDDPAYKPLSSAVHNMELTANEARERAIAASVIQGKIETNDYDLFLCYNIDYTQQIIQVEKLLHDEGVLPVLDEWSRLRGSEFPDDVRKHIEKVKLAVLVIGKNGLARGHYRELERMVEVNRDRGRKIVSVFLPDAPKSLELPLFLRGRATCDFRHPDPGLLKHLSRVIQSAKESE